MGLLSGDEDLLALEAEFKQASSCPLMMWEEFLNLAPAAGKKP